MAVSCGATKRTELEGLLLHLSIPSTPQSNFCISIVLYNDLYAILEMDVPTKVIYRAAYISI